MGIIDKMDTFLVVEKDTRISADQKKGLDGVRKTIDSKKFPAILKDLEKDFDTFTVLVKKAGKEKQVVTFINNRWGTKFRNLADVKMVDADVVSQLTTNESYKINEKARRVKYDKIDQYYYYAGLWARAKAMLKASALVTISATLVYFVDILAVDWFMSIVGALAFMWFIATFFIPYSALCYHNDFRHTLNID